MDDLISRHGISAWLDNMGYSKLADVVMDEDRFPSAQPETHDKRTESHACDLIDRQPSYSCSHEDDTICRRAAVDAMFAKMPGLTFGDVLQILHELPSAQPETAQNVSDGDLISRKAVLDELRFQYDRDTTTDPEDGTDWILYEEAVRNIEKLPSAQPESATRTAETAQNVSDSDLISRKDAIDALDCINGVEEVLRALPSAQPKSYREGYQAGFKDAQSKQCEYYALCRHGRDENKLRARLGFCEYCNEDAGGFVTPLEKNGHAFVRFGMNGWEIDLSAKGWRGSAKIRYCPMCGRDLFVK